MGPELVEQHPHIRQLASAVQAVTEEMEGEGWVALNPDDKGEFGREVHRRVSPQLHGQGRWFADVFVDNTTREVLSVGPGGAPGVGSGYTQVDLVHMTDGNAPVVGQVLDPDTVEDLVDIKTSVRGTIDVDQRARLRALIDDRDIKVVSTPRRWDPKTSSWIVNNKWQLAAGFFSLVGVGAAGYNLVQNDSYDAELQAIVAKVEGIRSRDYSTIGGEATKRLEVFDVANDLTNYLSHFTVDEMSIDILRAALLYSIIGQE